MTNKTTDQLIENIADEEIDIDILCKREYVEDLNMRHEYYFELIKEFED